MISLFVCVFVSEHVLDLQKLPFNLYLRKYMPSGVATIACLPNQFRWSNSNVEIFIKSSFLYFLFVCNLYFAIFFFELKSNLLFLFFFSFFFLVFHIFFYAKINTKTFTFHVFVFIFVLFLRRIFFLNAPRSMEGKL